MTLAPMILTMLLAAEGAAGGGYVAAADLLARPGWRMSVDENSGIYEFRGPGRCVSVVPGFEVADDNGRALRLPSPAVFRDGRLLLPAGLFPEASPALAGQDPRAEPAAGSSLAGLRRVVLDPGHGGRDPGAIGPGGLREKDVALSVALRLRALLEAQGVEVIMTRRDDRFISLEARSALANRSGADLFLSIHCNACRSPATSGVETFALTPEMGDAKRAWSAARRYRPSDLVPGALDSLSPAAERAVFRAHLDEQRRRSLELAAGLQAELAASLDEEDRGVKLRNFSVLRETYIPAALVEVGFISHRPTESRLRSAARRQRIAEALAAGLGRYSWAQAARRDRIALEGEEDLRLADAAGRQAH